MTDRVVLWTRSQYEKNIVLEIVSETDKAYQLRRVDNGHTAWLPKSILGKPVPRPNGTGGTSFCLWRPQSLRQFSWLREDQLKLLYYCKEKR